MIIPKSQMSEEDIKLNFITPALEARGWKGFFTMETRITDGKILLRGNLTTRDAPKKVDYLLFFEETTLSSATHMPAAIVEAKDNTHSVSAGLQQSKQYCEKLDVKFAYSSNGDGFEEYDYFTGKERTLSLDEFPTPEQLRARYYAEMNGGAGITDLQKRIFNQPYYSSQDTYPPRFYQRIAVDRTLNAISLGENRVLLVMATGTGKTYVAFQIIYRLLQSGLKSRVLYLADRNILVDQSIEQDFSPLVKIIHKVHYQKDQNRSTSHEVYFSLYQQLIGDNGEKRYAELFRPSFFDLVIVDECHRGSAKEDSNWREILEYFSIATQIGMTATPKETQTVSNSNYFGAPVYSYSLNEGIEDGYLAPFKVLEPRMNISDGWRPYKEQKDIYGQEIEDRIYNVTDFDYNIVLEDRVREVAEVITKYLKSTDRMQKTIVFCANIDAAERMRKELVHLNADMMAEHPDYVVRITGDDDYGKGKLDYFISVGQPFPVIATTSELLSTGVDTKMVKLIVLDKHITSMTSFKQIIGRGTRIVERAGKLYFVLMDFRGVSRLFADPGWDGPVEISPNFVPGEEGTGNGGNFGGEDEKNGEEPAGVAPPPSDYKPIVDKNGCAVYIIHETVSIYDPQGKLLRQENVVNYTKSNIVGAYGDLQQFIRHWSTLKKKEEISVLLKERGIDLEMLKREQNMGDVDDFDFICHIAYDRSPQTRAERAGKVRRSDFFSKYSGPAREILEALLDKYMNLGIKEIEQVDILKMEPFSKFGKPAKIAGFFGGRDGYKKAIEELEAELYVA